MTLHITEEMQAAYNRYLNESVDCDVLGTPILRKDTFPYAQVDGYGFLEFAAGYQAAMNRGKP